MRPFWHSKKQVRAASISYNANHYRKVLNNVRRKGAATLSLLPVSPGLIDVDIVLSKTASCRLVGLFMQPQWWSILRATGQAQSQVIFTNYVACYTHLMTSYRPANGSQFDFWCDAMMPECRSTIRIPVPVHPMFYSRHPEAGSSNGSCAAFKREGEVGHRWALRSFIIRYRLKQWIVRRRKNESHF